MDDDSGDGNNFKIQCDLEYNQAVYIRVRDYSYGAIDGFSLHINCTSHECEFVYTPQGINYHILKCHCGCISGTQTRHTLDPDSLTVIDGLSYKKCRFCKALVISNSSGFIPVQGIIPEIDTLSNRDEESQFL